MLTLICLAVVGQGVKGRRIKISVEKFLDSNAAEEEAAFATAVLPLDTPEAAFMSPRQGWSSVPHAFASKAKGTSGGVQMISHQDFEAFTARSKAPAPTPAQVAAPGPSFSQAGGASNGELSNFETDFAKELEAYLAAAASEPAPAPAPASAPSFSQAGGASSDKLSEFDAYFAAKGFSAPYPAPDLVPAPAPSGGASDPVTLRLGETQSLASNRLWDGQGSEADQQTAVSVHAPSFGIEARWDPSSVFEEGGAGKDMPSWQVFATRPFDEGEVVECCPLLPVRGEERINDAEQSMFSSHLVFDDERRSDKAAFVPLGYGMLYRRAAPNESALKLQWSADGSSVILLAQARVEAGEELLLPADGFHSMPPFKPEETSTTPEISDIDASCQRFQALRYFSSGVTAGAIRPGKSSVHGNGVFALQRELKPNTVIELCPVLVLKTRTDENVVSDYVMNVDLTPKSQRTMWSCKSETENILALGCGAVYNHRMRPTVIWEYIPHLGGNGLMVMKTTRAVQAGSELFISYGSGYFTENDQMK